jgi:hypothetical protein
MKYNAFHSDCHLSIVYHGLKIVGFSRHGSHLGRVMSIPIFLLTPICFILSSAVVVYNIAMMGDSFNI